MSEKSELKQLQEKVGGKDVETVGSGWVFFCKERKEMELWLEI